MTTLTSMTTPTRIAIAAGGTAGHLAPALAVADELSAHGSNVRFICGDRHSDVETISQRGYTAWTFPVQGMSRRPGIAQLRAVLLAIVGVVRCRKMLRAWGIDAVLAGGGFVSAPAAVAARTLGIPVVATEADAHLGLANRISTRVARRLCSAYPLPQARRKQVVTGRPVARDFGAVDRARSRADFGISSGDRAVVVFGGSGGATALSEAAWSAWGADADPRVGEQPMHIFHIAGRRDYPSFAQRERGSARYHLIEYSDAMPQLLAAADLVVCRSGGSVFELAASGVPAILVPYPHATADHQRLNAEHFVRAGAARCIDDGLCTGDTLRAMVSELLADERASELNGMAGAMQRMARPDAAAHIASVTASLAREHVRLHRIVHHASPLPLAGRRFHMMGIGGAGVSALAQVATAWGATVSGCDQSDSSYADLVRSAGIDVHIGHDPRHIDASMEVVVSSALPSDHPERVAAQTAGCRVWLRGELLGELTTLKRTIVVAGAHGKSTTTAMIAHALHQSGVDATVVLGATMGDAGNAHTGAAEWMVVEGDESDRTLLALHADIAVVTNIERDHHHTYPTDESLFAVYDEWVRSLADGIPLIVGPGPMADDLVRRHGHRMRVVRIADMHDEQSQVRRVLSVPGDHNVLNAAASMAVCRAVGVADEQIEQGLASFTGIGRRFERHGVNADGVIVVDDYAHHPSEVRATIAAAREVVGDSGRVCVVFQPHLFSRTHELWESFATSLATADRVWVLPIYGAREAPVDGVSSELITDELHRIAPGVCAGVIPADPATGDLATIRQELIAGDIVITMGAGTITQMAPRLAATVVPASVRGDDR